MINSVDKISNTYSSVTASVLIEKGEERRLTYSFHNWENQYEKYKDTFSQANANAQQNFKVVQGDPSTAVGFVRERISNTDIT